MLRLRLRGPDGQSQGIFDGAASIATFVAAAAEQLGCGGAPMELRVGFPPKPCALCLCALPEGPALRFILSVTVIHPPYKSSIK
jgi:hypothetical protein